MAKRVVLDDECCVGCEACVELCPEVFEMEESGEKARVIKAEGGGAECIEEAIETCPESCISWSA